MLQPKRTKYRRPQRLSYEGLTKGGANIEFGEFGLQALEGAYITNRQIESARIVLASYTRRVGKIWIRIFPHLAKTKNHLKCGWVPVRAPDSWVAVVKRIVFSLKSVALKKKSLVKHSASQRTNYQLRHA